MKTEEQNKPNAQNENGDKISVKRADLEALRRKVGRARRTLENAATLYDELEGELDRLTERSADVS
ncbi:MAG TPA: hypothetical protein VF297_05145 [Pyrinomonadaceae bacterium]